MKPPPTPKYHNPSSRWAIWKWHDIPDKYFPEHVYLRRLRILATPWFAVMLHFVYLTDTDRDPHDHPWNFWSFIVKGGYIEHVWMNPRNRKRNLYNTRTWGRFTLHKMSKHWAHKITEIKPGTITLVFTGKRTRDWTFWLEDGSQIEWKVYVDANS